MEFAVEQPGDQLPQWLPDGRRNRFYHRRGASSAHLFRTDEFIAVRERARMELLQVLQCPWGALSPKPSDIWATPRLAARLRSMEAAVCRCLVHVPARGRNPDGTSRSKERQVYTGAWNRRISTALADTAHEVCGSAADDHEHGSAPDPLLDASDDTCETDSDDDGTAGSDVDTVCSTQDGMAEIRYGPELHPAVRRAVAERASRTAGATTRRDRRRRRGRRPSRNCSSTPRHTRRSWRG
jgi:hypothetical protein